jgi:hypothetical protein
MFFSRRFQNSFKMILVAGGLLESAITCHWPHSASPWRAAPKNEAIFSARRALRDWEFKGGAPSRGPRPGARQLDFRALRGSGVRLGRFASLRVARILRTSRTKARFADF